MCIIAVKPEGKELFPEETIKTMFLRNPDGAGFMFFNKKTNKVESHKGFFNCEDLLKALKEVEDLKDTNAVLHFRIGTSGLMDDLNCHPYPVFEENQKDFETDLAVAHNGVLRDYSPSFGSKINDTQTFIQNVLRKLSPDFVTDPEKMFLIKKLIGSNKLAFLDKNNEIYLIGDFIEDSGYYYSNSSYKEERVKLYSTAPLWSSSYLDSLSSNKKENKKKKTKEKLEKCDEFPEDFMEFETCDEMMNYLDELDRLGSLFYDGHTCYQPDYINNRLYVMED